MTGYEDIDTSALGPNMWLIDEMYRRFQEDPDSVDEKWRDFFEDFRPRIGETVPPAALAEAVAEQAPEAKATAVQAPEPKTVAAATRTESLDGEAADKPEKKAARTAQVPPGAERLRF